MWKRLTQNSLKETQSDYKETPNDHTDPKTTPKDTEMTKKETQTGYNETPNDHTDPKRTPKDTEITKKRHKLAPGDTKWPHRPQNNPEGHGNDQKETQTGSKETPNDHTDPERTPKDTEMTKKRHKLAPGDTKWPHRPKTTPKDTEMTKKETQTSYKRRKKPTKRHKVWGLGVLPPGLFWASKTFPAFRYTFMHQFMVGIPLFILWEGKHRWHSKYIKNIMEHKAVRGLSHQGPEPGSQTLTPKQRGQNKIGYLHLS